MKFSICLLCGEEFKLTLFQLDIPIEEKENVEDALDCEMLYNDLAL